MVESEDGGRVARDRLIDAEVARLRQKKNTRADGDRLAAAIDLVRRMERSRLPEDEDVDVADLLREIADSHADRIENTSKGAKPPSHLYDLRVLWDTLTRCVASILATAPVGPGRIAYCRTHLQTLWVEWLEQKRPAAVTILDHALEAKEPALIAFRLLADARNWNDREKVRRALKRVKLLTPW